MLPWRAVVVVLRGIGYGFGSLALAISLWAFVSSGLIHLEKHNAAKLAAKVWAEQNAHSIENAVLGLMSHDNAAAAKPPAEQAHGHRHGKAAPPVERSTR